MKKTKPTTPDVVRKYEPDGLDIFGGGMPRDNKRKQRRIIQPDDRFALLATICALFAIVLIGFIVFGQQIRFVDRRVAALDARVSTIETQPEPTNPPTITPEPTPEPTVTSVPESLPLPAGSDGSFKAIEYESSITRESSNQWYLKQLYVVDSIGFCRVGEYYSVAMGTFYAEYIGQTFVVELESKTIKVIIGDVKADKDTIDRMYCRINGSILEFIVKKDTITHDQLQAFMKGKIISIRREINP